MSVASELAKAAIEASRGLLNDLSAHTVAKKIGDYPVEFKDPVLGDEFVAVPMNTPEGFGYVQKNTLYQYDLNKPVEYDEFNMVLPQDYAEMSSEGGDLVADTLKQGRAEDAVTRRGQMGVVPDELPMDYASRMARAGEQGFDTSQHWFHGTRSDISEFGPPRNARNDQMGGLGTHLAADPSFAGQYAGKGQGRKGNSPNVMDVFVRGRVLDTEQIVKEGTPEFDLVMDLYKNKPPPMSVMTDENGVKIAYLRNAIEAVTPKHARKVMDSHGVSALRYNAEMRTEGVGGYMKGEASDSLVVLDPSNIRSATSAAFDPANAGKNDLLGAATPSRLAATALAGGVGVAAVRSPVPEGDRWTTEMADAWDAQRREVIDSVLSAVGEGLVSVDDAITGLVNYAFGPKKYFHSTGGDSTAGADAINVLRPGVRTLGEGLAEQDPEKIGLGLLL